MITKNEEKYLAKCLQSVKPISDEIVVVDTGSEDRTREIAVAYGAKVFNFRWQDDFANARNYSMSKAGGDWILILDADEVIAPIDYEGFRELIGHAPDRDAAFSIKTRNYTALANTVGWNANSGRYAHEEAGSGWFPLNVKGALRQSSSIAYLHPLADLPANLEVRTDTLATRLLLEQERVVGADTERGQIRARAEVILCAGSINTPQLLMLSGIGPGADLQRLGIPVTRDLPGVGQNLLDHVAANIACELRQASPPWRLTPCESTALIQIDADAPAPDVLFHFVLMLRDKYTDIDHFGAIEHGVKLSPNVARPRSRGSLRLTSADYRDAPLIDLNYFSDAEGYDQRILIAALRYARELVATPALSSYIKAEVLPGPGVVGDDELLAYIRETAETVFHPSGTCRIGAADDPLSVVTPDLRVKGLDGLRVADASVFPSMVTVNICNTVMMVAERAAAMIVED